MKEHNIKEFLDDGVCVTINSDDPAYFGGCITDNFLAVVNEPTL
jgi:adenine deaminase